MTKTGSLIFYLTIYILSAYGLHGAFKMSNKKLRLLFVVMAICIPCLMASYRYGVGTDYDNNYNMFNYYSKMSLNGYLNYSNAVEPAFYLFSKIAGLFKSYRFFFFLFAVAIYAPIVSFIASGKHRQPIFLMTFIFLLTSFTSGLNIMRQMAAVSICFYSTKFIIEKKHAKYLFGICVASLFHITALVMLPLYYVWSTRKRWSVFDLKTILIYIAYFSAAICVPYILRLMGGRYAGYVNNAVHSANLSIVLNVIWVSVYLLSRKRILKNNSEMKLFLIMAVIGMILSFTGLYSPYIKRIAIYFSCVEFVLLPQMSVVFSKRTRKFVYILIFIYEILIFILSYGVLGHSDIVPYRYK